MTPRLAAGFTLVVLVTALVGLVGLGTPWRAVEPGDRGERPASMDFTSAERHREVRFHKQLRPWSYSALALSVLLAVVLGFTPLGARIVELVARPLGGGWVWRAILGGLALTLLAQLLILPLRARAEIVLRRYDLSTQTWRSWFIDLTKAWAITAALTVILLLAFYAIARAMPRWWWLPMAAAAAGLIFVLSFLYPIVFEPIFNKFTPMEDSPLRRDLIALAEKDGVPVRDVLVADASRRTNTLNAYVSGYGASRRIVVYDTLLNQAPDDEVKLVVAHELGHAKRNDVLFSTAIAALAGAAAVIAGYLVLTWRPLLRRAGVTELADPRSMALLMALIAIVGVLSLPIQNLISRRVEARADGHSLRLTGDPATFIRMHRRLAVKNLADLDPNQLQYVMFASHPSTTERLGEARDYARQNSITLPADLSGQSPVAG